MQPEPIYEALALQDGVHLPSAGSRHGHFQRQVSVAMRDATDILPAQMTVREAFETTRTSEFRAWPVTDARGVVGVIGAATLERELTEGGAAKTLSELVDVHNFPHLHSDQSLETALERMGATGLDVLPVVSRVDVHKLVGVVTLREVLDSYGVGPLGLA